MQVHHNVKLRYKSKFIIGIKLCQREATWRLREWIHLQFHATKCLASYFYVFFFFSSPTTTTTKQASTRTAENLTRTQIETILVEWNLFSHDWDRFSATSHYIVASLRFRTKYFCAHFLKIEMITVVIETLKNYSERKVRSVKIFF